MKIAIYNANFAVLGGGERRTAVLAAHLAREHDVTLFVHSPVSNAAIKTIFGVDLANVEIVALLHKDHPTELARCQPDLFINNSHGSSFPNPAPRGIYMCMFPEVERLDLRGYQIITANSGYTAEWIKKRWGRPSEVVYSACQNMGPPAAKEKILLNVARFFSDTEMAHHKRQDTLLHAFKRLIDGGLRGWELHLVGMGGHADEDRAFVEGLRNGADGYPVHIRPSVKFQELRDVYQRASIYWHATGFGSPAQPSKKEHFGMSIVEAMSAGAVPIVFNAGGPREVINSGVNGYLWNNLSEFMILTLNLIEDPHLLQNISAAAITRSKFFDASRFLARMDGIIERIMAPSV